MSKWLTTMGTYHVTYLRFPGHMTNMKWSLKQFGEKNDGSCGHPFCMSTYWNIPGPLFKMLQWKKSMDTSHFNAQFVVYKINQTVCYEIFED